MTVSTLNRSLERSRAAAEAELPELVAVYQRALAKLAVDAARTFTALTAVAWHPPPDGMLSSAIVGAAASLAAAQEKVHRRILRVVAGPPLARLGIAWDVKHPLSQRLLEQAGQRTGDRLGQAVQPVLREALATAYNDGLSVPDTAALIRDKLVDAAAWQADMLARTDLNGLANGGSVIAARLAGANFKSWEATLDDRTRPEHADAHGQTVPVDQPFQVGGEPLDFPGDPAGSDAMVANCRCTVTYGDSLTAAAAPTLAGDEMATIAQTRWVSDLAFEGEATADGRYMLPRSLEPRELPLTLMAMTVTDDGHDGAFVAGRIDRVGRRSSNIDGEPLPDGVKSLHGEGIFDMGGDNGAEIARLVAEQVLRGVSVDLGILAWCFRDPDTGELIEPTDATDDQMERAFFGELQFAVRKAEILAATVCPTPAFANARIALAASASSAGTIRVWSPLRIAAADDGIMDECAKVTPSVATAVTPSTNTAASDSAKPATKIGDSPARFPISSAPNAEKRSLAVAAETGARPASHASPRGPGDSLARATHGSKEKHSRPAAHTPSPPNRSGLRLTAAGASSALATSAATQDSEFTGTISSGSWKPKVISARSAATRSRTSQGEEQSTTHTSTTAPDHRNFADGSADHATEALAASATTQNGSNKQPPTSESIAPLKPPRDWFLTSELPGPCPLTITREGRVYGHVALWDQCHVSFENACVRPPRSPSNYQKFHVGVIETDDGELLPIGKLMVGSRHAPLALAMEEARNHYDDNATVGAYVRAIDGRYGIWVSGVLRHDLSPERLRDFRANPPSGDWRAAGSHLDLIAALAVPIPGYPVPRAEANLIASAGGLTATALIATPGQIEMSAQVFKALIAAGLLAEEDCDCETAASDARTRALLARAEGGIDGLLELATEGAAT